MICLRIMYFKCVFMDSRHIILERIKCKLFIVVYLDCESNTSYFQKIKLFS